MNKDSKELILRTLAEYLGVEPEDIKEEDELESDLHMQPSDLSDFIESLQEIGIDTSKVDLTQIETVTDLIENLGLD